MPGSSSPPTLIEKKNLLWVFSDNFFFKIDCAEAATGGLLLEKLFLEISQNSQENTCVRVSFLKKLPRHFLIKLPLASVYVIPPGKRMSVILWKS